MELIISQIVKEVEEFNESIKDALSSKNISNTGEAANSLRIEHGEDFVKSIGIFYLEFLDTGRGPGKMPPIKPLILWAQNKYGVDYDEAKSIAWGTAKKIAKLGTEIFINQGQGIELEKKVLTLKENLNKSLPNSVGFEIKQELDKFKKIFYAKKFEL